MVELLHRFRVKFKMIILSAVLISSWLPVSLLAADEGWTCPPDTCLKFVDCAKMESLCAKEQAYDSTNTLFTGLCVCCGPCHAQLLESEEGNFGEVGENETYCIRLRKVALEWKDAEYIPNCRNGNFDEVQCFKNDTCFCSSKTGEVLMNIKSTVSNKPLCRCAVQYTEKDVLSDMCNEDGNFKTKRCDDDKCYCVNEFTGFSEYCQGEIPHFLTELGMSAQCPKHLPRSFKLPCIEQRERALKDESCIYPKCSQLDENLYEPLQCDLNKCYCYSPQGKALYRIKDIADINVNITCCSCALALEQHIERKRFCDAQGNYKEVICTNGSCTCYDRISGAVVTCKPEVLASAKWTKPLNNLADLLKKIGSADSSTMSVHPSVMEHRVDSSAMSVHPSVMEHRVDSSAMSVHPSNMEQHPLQTIQQPMQPLTTGIYDYQKKYPLQWPDSYYKLFQSSHLFLPRNESWPVQGAYGHHDYFMPAHPSAGIDYGASYYPTPSIGPSHHPDKKIYGFVQHYLYYPPENTSEHLYQYSLPPRQPSDSYLMPPSQPSGPYPMPPLQPRGPYPMPPSQPSTVYHMPPLQPSGPNPMPLPQPIGPYPIPPPQPRGPYQMPPSQPRGPYRMPPPQPSVPFLLPLPQPSGPFPLQPFPQPSGPFFLPRPQPSGQYAKPPPQPRGPFPLQPLPQPSGPFFLPRPQPSGPYAKPSPQPRGPYVRLPSQPSGPYAKLPLQPRGPYVKPPPQPMTSGPYPKPPPQPNGPYPKPPSQPSGPYPKPAPQPPGSYPKPLPRPSSPYAKPAPQPSGPYPKSPPQPITSGPHPEPPPQPSGPYPSKPRQPGKDGTYTPVPHKKRPSEKKNVFPVHPLLVSETISSFEIPCFQARLSMEEQNVPFVPRCNEKDPQLYQPLQCSKDKCYCFDPDGNLIWIVEEKSRIPSCKCPLAFRNRTDRYYYCDSDGHFRTHICEERSYLCFDRLTGKRVTENCFISPFQPEETRNRFLNHRLTMDAPPDFKGKCSETTDILLKKFGKEYSPNCTENGNYALNQCFFGRCYCYSSEGMLLWIMKDGISAQPNCQCAMKMKSFSMRQMYCDDMGNFKEKLCDFYGCYCFNKFTGRKVICPSMPGTGTRKDNRTMNIIYKWIADIREFKRSCAEHQKEAIARRDTIIPTCADRDVYYPLQCNAYGCFCVSGSGKYLEVSVPYGESIECRCPAQRFRMIEEKMPEALLPKCKTNGIYKEIQCNKDAKRCYCVNSYGHIMMKVTSTDSNKIYCQCTKNARTPNDFNECDSGTGNYNPELVCQEDTCTCRDKYTGKLTTNCDEVLPKEKPGFLRTPCIESVHNSFEQEKLCDADGFYKPVVCLKKSCYCVSRETGIIKSCRAGPSEYTRRDLTWRPSGPCYSHQNEALNQNLPLVPRCRKDNLYFAPHQCTNTKCMCYDPMGYEMEDNLPLTAFNDAFCTSCNRMRRNALKTPSVHLVPCCDMNGEHTGVECLKGGSVCFCVDQYSGKLWRLERSEDQISLSKTYCTCVQDLKYYADRQMRCDPKTGNYKTYVCTNDGCYCVHHYTGHRVPCEITVPIGRKNPLKAFELSDHFNGPCIQRRKEARDLSAPIIPRCLDNFVLYAAHQCGPIDCMCVNHRGEVTKQSLPLVIANNKPVIDDRNCEGSIGNCVEGMAVSISGEEQFNARCTPDYHYNFKQCSSKHCFCVTRDGRFVGPKVLKEMPLNCDCTMQRQLNIELRASWIPKCEKDGSFAPLQCTENRWCVCVDKNGKAVWDIGNEEITGNACHCAINMRSDEERLEKCDAMGNYKIRICSQRKRCSCFDQYTGVPVDCVRMGLSPLDNVLPVIQPGIWCNESRQMALRNGQIDVLPVCSSDLVSYRPLQCGLKYCQCYGPTGKLLKEHLLRKENALDSMCFTGFSRRCEPGRQHYIYDLGWIASWCEESYLYVPKQCNFQSCMCVGMGGRSLLYKAPVNEELYCRCPRSQELQPHISCTPRGYYSPVQCSEHFCKCVDKFGFPLPYEVPHVNQTSEFYYHWKQPATDISRCLCAIAEAEEMTNFEEIVQGSSMKTRRRRKSYLRCDWMGNYQAMQCDPNRCYCVNKYNGKRISSPVPLEMSNTLSCESLPQYKELPKEFGLATGDSYFLRHYELYNKHTMMHNKHPQYPVQAHVPVSPVYEKYPGYIPPSPPNYPKEIESPGYPKQEYPAPPRQEIPLVYPKDINPVYSEQDNSIAQPRKEISQPEYLGQEQHSERPIQEVPQPKYPGEERYPEHPSQQVSQPEHPRQEISQPEYPGQEQYPEHPSQQVSQPEYPGQEISQPEYPGQQISQPKYPGQEQYPEHPRQEISQPEYPGQQISQPEYPGQEQYPERPSQQASQPEYPGQEQYPERPSQQVSQPEYPGQEQYPEHPGQQVSQPEHPGQQVSQPEHPGQQISQPEYPGQQISQPDYPGQEQYPEHPSQQVSQPKYPEHPNQEIPQPIYPGQEQYNEHPRQEIPQPIYPGQEQYNEHPRQEIPQPIYPGQEQYPEHPRQEIPQSVYPRQEQYPEHPNQQISQPEYPQRPRQEISQPVYPGQEQYPENPRQEIPPPKYPGQKQYPELPRQEIPQPVYPGQEQYPASPKQVIPPPKYPGQEQYPEHISQQISQPVYPGQEQYPESPRQVIPPPKYPGQEQYPEHPRQEIQQPQYPVQEQYPESPRQEIPQPVYPGQEQYPASPRQVIPPPKYPGQEQYPEHPSQQISQPVYPGQGQYFEHPRQEMPPPKYPGQERYSERPRQEIPQAPYGQENYAGHPRQENPPAYTKNINPLYPEQYNYPVQPRQEIVQPEYPGQEKYAGRPRQENPPVYPGNISPLYPQQNNYPAQPGQEIVQPEYPGQEKYAGRPRQENPPVYPGNISPLYPQQYNYPAQPGQEILQPQYPGQEKYPGDARQENPPAYSGNISPLYPQQNNYPAQTGQEIPQPQYPGQEKYPGRPRQENPPAYPRNINPLYPEPIYYPSQPKYSGQENPLAYPKDLNPVYPEQYNYPAHPGQEKYPGYPRQETPLSYPNDMNLVYPEQHSFAAQPRQDIPQSPYGQGRYPESTRQENPPDYPKDINALFHEQYNHPVQPGQEVSRLGYPGQEKYSERPREENSLAYPRNRNPVYPGQQTPPEYSVNPSQETLTQYSEGLPLQEIPPALYPQAYPGQEPRYPEHPRHVSVVVHPGQEYSPWYHGATNPEQRYFAVPGSQNEYYLGHQIQRNPPDYSGYPEQHSGSVPAMYNTFKGYSQQPAQQHAVQPVTHVYSGYSDRRHPVLQAHHDVHSANVLQTHKDDDQMQYYQAHPVDEAGHEIYK